MNNRSATQKCSENRTARPDSLFVHPGIPRASYFQGGRLPEPGQQLRRVRERLGLKYRDIERASLEIANRRGNADFQVGLSRLADIENKETTPSIYRLYSLCAIYKLNFATVLGWYGVPVDQLLLDSLKVQIPYTHAINTEPFDSSVIDFPDFEPAIDLRRTTFLSREIEKWGKLPLALLNSLDIRNNRYAFLGLEDWSMYPILMPGSFLQIDQNKRRLVQQGWSQESDRPIYFVEHRDGYRAGWCTLRTGVLVLFSPGASQSSPEVFQFPGEAEIVGQVVGVAMRLDSGKRRHTRS